jgi:hypothetical protein
VQCHFIYYYFINVINLSRLFYLRSRPNVNAEGGPYGNVLLVSAHFLVFAHYLVSIQYLVCTLHLFAKILSLHFV